MPNAIDFEIKITGTNPKHVNKLVDWFMDAEWDYSIPRGLRPKIKTNINGVLKCYGKNGYWDTKSKRDGLSRGYSITLCGECANSLMTSMFSYSRVTLPTPTTEIITLQTACARLGVRVEAYSHDGGNNFEEHVVCDRTGVITTEDHTDVTDYETSKTTYDKFNATFGTAYTEDDFKNNTYVKIGGFKWEYPKVGKILEDEFNEDDI